MQNVPRRSEAAPSADRLSAALAEMDRAFGPRADSVGPVDGCGHCFDPEHLRLIGGPVDAIPDWLFSRAVSKWGTTMDADRRLWRRFTPRIMRQLTGGSLHIAEGLVARKFNEAGWRDWPDGERAAFEGVCDAWWQTVLATQRGTSATTALEFLVLLTGDVDVWLGRWDTAAGRGAAAQFRDLWASWGLDLLTGELNINFFGAAVDVAPQVTAWILRQGERFLELVDFEERDLYALRQLALPETERWR